jgi:hypothetical protein
MRDKIPETTQLVVDDLLGFFLEFVPEVYVTLYKMSIRKGRVFWGKENAGDEMSLILVGVTEETIGKLIEPKLEEWKKVQGIEVYGERLVREAYYVYCRMANSWDERLCAARQKYRDHYQFISRPSSESREEVTWKK